MSKRGLIAGFLLSASLLFGQIDSNTLTVTASRNTNLQPDQIVFSVTVTSGPSADLNDVVAALQGTGITAANFTGISTSFQPVTPGRPTLQLTITWGFTLVAPLSKVKDTISTLNTIQQNVGKQKNGLALNFSIQGTQVSQQQAQSQPCVMSDLLADARTQAQNLASAAGFTLDTILGMSSVTSNSQGLGFAAFASVPPCTVTVKFAVRRQ